MFDRKIGLLILTVASLLLISSCQTKPPVQEPELVVEQPLLAPSVLINNAIDDLGKGQAGKAAKALRDALKQQPDNPLALDLLRQIEADPQQYLGAEHFMYTVKRGDSMSSLAQRYLKNSLRFYILARYSGLSDPSRLRLGQVLKIPGVDPDAEPVRSARSLELEEVSSLLLKKKQYSKVINLLEIEVDELRKTPEIRDILLESYEAQALAAEAEGELQVAKGYWEKSEKLAPKDKQILKHIASLNTKTQAIELFDSAQKELQIGNDEEALSMLTRSLKLFPGYAPAMSAHKIVKQALIDRYHKDALLHFRNQELVEAIASWDRVLELDPGHQTAMGYRARSLEMKARLSELGL